MWSTGRGPSVGRLGAVGGDASIIRRHTVPTATDRLLFTGLPGDQLVAVELDVWGPWSGASGDVRLRINGTTANINYFRNRIEVGVTAAPAQDSAGPLGYVRGTFHITLRMATERHGGERTGYVTFTSLEAGTIDQLVTTEIVYSDTTTLISELGIIDAGGSQFIGAGARATLRRLW